VCARAFASPDEEALVIGAKGSGFWFKRRQHTRVTVEVQGEVKPRAYEVLHVCEFNSTRKRMSVVVRPRRLLTAQSGRRSLEFR